MKVINRFEISVRCPKFDFSHFPFDHQNCSIVLRTGKSAQNFDLTGTVETEEEFTYESLNIQYAIEVTEFDISAAKDSPSYVGVTLKFTRHFPPFYK